MGQRYGVRETETEGHRAPDAETRHRDPWCPGPAVLGEQASLPVTQRHPMPGVPVT